MSQMHKYPRTQHILGSRLQPGDEDLEAIPFQEIAGRHLVVEEKVDGANSGISFGEDGALLLQSRGHYLTGGARERHFALFKTWAVSQQDALRSVLQNRYIMYGEWLYARHTIYYDYLPHYFLEFDILDTSTGQFLSTPRRRALLQNLPIRSVPVLRTGRFQRLDQLTGLIQKSLFKSERWRDSLRESIQSCGLSIESVTRETDPSDDAEGLYIKVEDDDAVIGRFKFIRPGFLSAVQQSGSHWLKRPILPNRLEHGIDLFEAT